MYIANLAMLVIMLVVVLDVSMRYLFAAPLGWSYDVIGYYLMVCLFFFALSHTLQHHHHIAIDIFTPRIPHRILHLMLALGYLASVVVMALITWQAWIRFEGAWKHRDLISMSVPLETWPSYVIVIIGAAVITLRCVLRAWGHAASAITGRTLVAMPPPPEASPLGARGKTSGGVQ